MPARQLRDRSTYTLIAVSIAIVGCGGTKSSPAGQARSVVQQYYADLVGGHGAGACSLLTKEAKEKLVQPLLIYRAQLEHGINCIELMTLDSKVLRTESAARRELEAATIGAVKVTGNRAVAVVKEPNRSPREAPLVKTVNGWRISELILRVTVPRKLIEG